MNLQKSCLCPGITSFMAYSKNCALSPHFCRLGTAETVGAKVNSLSVDLSAVCEYHALVCFCYLMRVAVFSAAVLVYLLPRPRVDGVDLLALLMLVLPFSPRVAVGDVPPTCISGVA